MSQPEKGPSNTRTIVFIVILSFVCALVLSVMASALAKPQETARELDRSQQMLMSARIFNRNGYFQIKTPEGKYAPAKFSAEGILAPGTVQDIATNDQVIAVYKKRTRVVLIDEKGEITSFEKAKIDEDEYMATNKKRGFANLPFKLAYEILPNDAKSDAKPEGYIIPVAGYGLWDAIYGYIAIEIDATHVIGISWYDHKETPGLGANITEDWFQDQFVGKSIYLGDGSGKIDYKTSPIGITVVRGKVSEVFGDTNPKSKGAVDGMAGATLTGSGVTKAYQDSLRPYRPFFMKLHEEFNKTPRS